MRAVFIGDEISAAGFRLAGIDTLTPEAGTVERELQRVARDASFILITAQAAREVSDPVLKHFMLARKPMLLVVPDMREQVEPDDLVTPIREHLGIREDLIAAG